MFYKDLEMGCKKMDFGIENKRLRIATLGVSAEKPGSPTSGSPTPLIFNIVYLFLEKSIHSLKKVYSFLKSGVGLPVVVGELKKITGGLKNVKLKPGFKSS